MKSQNTYIIPLNAMPWWLFFFKLSFRDLNCQNFGGVIFEIWHLGISTVKILVACCFKIFPSKNYRKFFSNKIWWRCFFEV
eukprot:UN24097